MFRHPVTFQDFLIKHGATDDVYRALENPDLSETVVTILNILKKTKQRPVLVKDYKAENKSTALRNEGNQAYAKNEYQKALMCYNKALLYAPKNSRAMKLAYSNRSALFFKIKSVSACIEDIATVFSMGCPPDITDKLNKRREDAQKMIWAEKLAESVKYDGFPDEFFELDEPCHPTIPCASTDVGVIKESGIPKVVAAKNIKVGDLLAVEPCFVSQTHGINTLISCHYCQKITLNLKPCDNCCVALFCDTFCEEDCVQEYHSIECQIMEVVDTLSTSAMSRLAIKAVLKMISMSSWKEVIAASLDMGLGRMKKSSVNDIFDHEQPFSLLNVKDERQFFYGSFYNASMTCSNIVSHLENVADFFPQNKEDKAEAIRAFARIMIFLNLFSTHTQIRSTVSLDSYQRVQPHDMVNFGWFSFIGKLKHSCTPNVLAVGLNNQMGLVAVQPIKRGTELTVAYLGHWLDSELDKDIRRKILFKLYRTVCNCLICTNEYKHVKKTELTEGQKRNYRKLNVRDMEERFNVEIIPTIFPKLCKTLAFLSDQPYSDEYREVYQLFRLCILYLQDNQTRNVLLEPVI